MIVFAPNPERGSNGQIISATLENDGSFTLSGADGKSVAAGCSANARAVTTRAMQLARKRRVGLVAVISGSSPCVQMGRAGSAN